MNLKLALKFSKKKSNFPKINRRSGKEKTNKRSYDKKKLGIISGATVGTVLAISLVMSNLIFKDEVPKEPTNNNATAWDSNTSNSQNNTTDEWDSSEEDFNTNNYEPLGESTGSIEVGSLTDEQLVASNKWYSLNNDEAKADTTSLGSTTTSTYSKIMNNINSSYAKEQQRIQQEKMKEEANKNKTNETTTQTPSNTNKDMSWGFPSNGSNGNNNSNSGNNGVQTTKPSDPSNQINSNNQSNSDKDNQTSNGSNDGKIDITLNKDGELDLEPFKKDGVTIIEGNSINTKLLDAMDSLTEKLIVDTQKEISEKEILNWVTNDYSNKLLVTKLNYGFLDESKRYFFLEIDYTVTEQQMKELRTYSSKKVKSLSTQKDVDKIKSIGNIVANLGNYNKTGKQNIFSPYTFYKYGYGVCQAYTTLGKIMLDTLGIENGIATGVLNNESHSWNVVKIDNAIYHVDFTLYDTLSKSSYLLIKDEDIVQDRTVNRIIWN